MDGFVPFFIILTVGLLLSEFFQRLHLPYVSALILGGVLIGPFGFDIIALDQTVEFFGNIGLIFLMFIAGTEVKISSFRKFNSEGISFAFLNGGVPFLIGILIGLLFNLNMTEAFVLGIVFISTSIAVVVPSLQSSGLLKSKLANIIIPATIMEDVAALFLLSIVISQQPSQQTLPWPVYIIALIGLVVVARYALPYLEKLFKNNNNEDMLFESELRFVFVSILATAIVFQILGLSPIIAGFAIGALMGDFINNSKVKEKIRTISYGIFIPIFFIVIGMQINVQTLFTVTSINMLFVLFFGLLIGKYLSVYIYDLLFKLPKGSLKLAGALTIPQLTTTLATVYAALEFGLLPQMFANALTVLSLITIILSPLLIVSFAKNLQQKHEEENDNSNTVPFTEAVIGEDYENSLSS